MIFVISSFLHHLSVSDLLECLESVDEKKIIIVIATIRFAVIITRFLVGRTAITVVILIIMLEFVYSDKLH